MFQSNTKSYRDLHAVAEVKESGISSWAALPTKQVSTIVASRDSRDESPLAVPVHDLYQ